jgi:hypothetical protein
VKPIDGFWLPKDVRQQVLTPETEFTTLSFAHGQSCKPDDEDAITTRWPLLQPEQWQRLVLALKANRPRAPQGAAFSERFQAALALVGRRLAAPSDPLHVRAMATLPGYTGYSEAMVRFTLSALDMWTLDQLTAAFRLAPPVEVATRWQPMDALPGRLRFYHADRWQRFRQWLLGRGKYSLFGTSLPLDMAVGYGAGNVPGTALLIAFLAQATTLTGDAPPVVVVKNSRREPIFAPLLLKALETVDPDLLCATAVLIWDYADAAVQEHLLAQADLVIAAASDGTIAQIDGDLRRHARPGLARFHPHGHKVSFSAIGREVLTRGLCIQPEGAALIDAVALLAALDSVFWDQHGCLSSRIHFVESGSQEHYSPLEYANHLTEQLGLLASFLPRGAWPQQRLHDRFDRYKLLESTGQVRVLTGYDDEFVVILDERRVDAFGFQALVNDCEGRVIVVRPVAELLEVPDRYLRLLPAANLQSLSVAVGREGEPLTAQFLRFAEACGERGVTAVRTVGRGAFPQLAYSWDGFIPLDLIRQRSEGRFTTIEFDAPYKELLTTYRLMIERGSALGTF